MRITQERRLFAIGFFFSFCIALAAYLNASYLRLFLSVETVGYVYSATALLTILVLYFFDDLGGRFGVQKTLVVSLIIAGLSALSLATQANHYIIMLSFMIMQISLVITKFSTDILVQTHKNANEGEGTLRGAYLAITNLSWIVAAFLGGFIATLNPQYIYGINSVLYIVLAIVSLFIISQTQKDIFTQTSIFEKIRYTMKEIGTRKIIVSEFILQTFYSVMLIFTPLYLHSELGFSFAQIGVIFSIMLFPFALLQYPLGRIADKKIGEKELLIGSYIMIFVSVFIFAITKNHTVYSVAILLFFTRVGACTLEVMNDTYFFNITQEYKKTIPIFKGMAPLSLLVFGTLGGIILQFSSYKMLFIGLAVYVLLVGLTNIYDLKDTK
jgi:DHA1 family tetracycline resistance protein-like MFS transporter